MSSPIVVAQATMDDLDGLTPLFDGYRTFYQRPSDPDAAREFLREYEPPANALPVYVVAKQWMWKLQHASGRREINELHVPLGEPVRLVMTAQDAIHSFYVPAFRLKQDVLPGRYTSMWFTATQPGEFHLFCAEYCGSEHSQMVGRIVVMPPAQFAAWVASKGGTMPGAAKPTSPDATVNSPITNPAAPAVAATGGTETSPAPPAVVDATAKPPVSTQGSTNSEGR